MNNTPWKINFPETPKGEEEVLIYYDQKGSLDFNYVKITRKDNMMIRYYWDGVSDSFNLIKVDRIVENKLIVNNFSNPL